MSELRAYYILHTKDENGAPVTEEYPAGTKLNFSFLKDGFLGIEFPDSSVEFIDSRLLAFFGIELVPEDDETDES